jgi:hypothetical protein
MNTVIQFEPIIINADNQIIEPLTADPVVSTPAPEAYSNAIDYAIAHPLEPIVIGLGAVAVGLVLRKLNDRHARDTAYMKQSSKATSDRR